jgi:hypothetical protein
MRCMAPVHEGYEAQQALSARKVVRLEGRYQAMQSGKPLDRECATALHEDLRMLCVPVLHFSLPCPVLTCGQMCATRVSRNH